LFLCISQLDFPKRFSENVGNHVNSQNLFNLHNIPVDELTDILKSNFDMLGVWIELWFFTDC
jgi:hypothetical protein